MKQFFMWIVIIWSIVYLLSSDYKQPHVNGVHQYGEEKR
jgi:hypothetical protein